MKLCLVCSRGGHLAEMLQLKKVYSRHDRFFITFGDAPGFPRGERACFVRDPKRNPLNIIVNFFQTLFTLLGERPDVIITTGAGVAIPVCYLGKLFRKKIIYIESFGRVTKPSLSGKMVHPIADLFLVQWKPLLKHYPRARYEGAVF